MMLLRRGGMSPDHAAALQAPQTWQPLVRSCSGHGHLLQKLNDAVDAADEAAAVRLPLPAGAATSSVMASMDEDDMTTEAKQCLLALREGKR